MSLNDSQYAIRGYVSMSRRGDYELTVRQENVEQPSLIKRCVRAKMIINFDNDYDDHGDQQSYG